MHLFDKRLFLFEKAILELVSELILGGLYVGVLGFLGIEIHRFHFKVLKIFLLHAEPRGQFFLHEWSTAVASAADEQLPLRMLDLEEGVRGNRAAPTLEGPQRVELKVARRSFFFLQFQHWNSFSLVNCH